MFCSSLRFTTMKQKPTFFFTITESRESLNFKDPSGSSSWVKNVQVSGSRFSVVPCSPVPPASSYSRLLNLSRYPPVPGSSTDSTQVLCPARQETLTSDASFFDGSYCPPSWTEKIKNPILLLILCRYCWCSLAHPGPRPTEPIGAPLAACFIASDLCCVCLEPPLVFFVF